MQRSKVGAIGRWGVVVTPEQKSLPVPFNSSRHRLFFSKSGAPGWSSNSAKLAGGTANFKANYWRSVVKLELCSAAEVCPTICWFLLALRGGKCWISVKMTSLFAVGSESLLQAHPRVRRLCYLIAVSTLPITWSCFYLSLVHHCGIGLVLIGLRNRSAVVLHLLVLRISHRENRNQKKFDSGILSVYVTYYLTKRLIN